VKTRGQPDRYDPTAQWLPMTYGMRKRARELDGLIVDTQVVYENDDFEWVLGDNGHIAHSARLGERGAMIGAYAIFRHPTEGILHREVMGADEIDTVKRQSRQPDSLMWKTFTTEAWRKTVARRGFKSVPVSPNLERLIRRDDDLFDFTAQAAMPAPQSIRERLAAGERPSIRYVEKTAPTVSQIDATGQDAAAGDTSPKPDEAPPDANGGPSEAIDADPDPDPEGRQHELALIAELQEALAGAATRIDVKVVADEFGGAIEVATEAMAKLLRAMIAKREEELR
jgi:recombination protein RecT